MKLTCALHARLLQGTRAHQGRGFVICKVRPKLLLFLEVLSCFCTEV